jgi:hypothetical protein
MRTFAPVQPRAPSPEPIMTSYLASLRAPGSVRTPAVTILLLYAAPLALSMVVYVAATANEQINWSYQALSIFSIFLGLLISVQMSVFSIYNRFRTSPAKEFSVDEAETRFAMTELKQINSLISYLNMISVAAMAASIFLAVVDAAPITQEAVVLFFYVHFMLNALLLLRRGHVLFQHGFGEGV